MAQKHVLKLSSLNNYFKDEMKLIERGENALESGHVLNMKYNDTAKTISGSVHASMKDKIYQVEIFLDKDKNITKSTCTCPRGQLSCHHVAATGLFAHYNVSVTDQSCSWSAPKVNAVEQVVKTIEELFPPTKEYRASKRDVSEPEIERLREELASFGGAVGFTWLLAPKLASQEENVVVNVGDVIFSEDYQKSVQKTSYFEEKIRVTPEIVLEVFQKTVGQSDNPVWLIAKKLRLTASSFGMILAACKRKSYPPSLFKRLTGTYNLDGVKAVQWGREHEADAVKAFTAATSLPVIRAGLWLHNCGYLGASPDGLVGEDALVEIKCPFKYRDSNLIQALSRDKKYICIFDVETQRFTINENHEYFHQIQGQLHLLNKKLCYLVIWTPRMLVVLNIVRNEKWAENIDVLQNFYINRFIPHVTSTT